MENENYELEVLNDDTNLDDDSSESSNGLLVGGVGFLLGIAGTLAFKKGVSKIKAMRAAKKAEKIVDDDEFDDEIIDVEEVKNVDEEDSKKSNK